MPRTVCDPTGEREPQAFLCTDLRADPADILRWFVRRWRTETTSVGSTASNQRQWSDRAILRTTPALLALFSLVALWAGQLLALFSLVALWAGQLAAERHVLPEQVRWYAKPLPTFSDALALIRHELWAAQVFVISPADRTAQNVPADLIDRLLLVACRPP